MSDPKDPKTPPKTPTPFGLDEHEWASELEAWDAQLPITTEGATPGEENAFVETPTTVVASEAQLAEAEAAALDFAQGPPSGVYESIVASIDPPDSPESLFAGEPPPELPVSLIAPPLPEMGDEVWRGDLRALCEVPETLEAPVVPPPSYWKGFGRQLIDQLSIADTAAQQADLTVAAARAAERAGDPEDALRLYDDALVLQAGNAAARRGRFRLLEARGDREGAFAALGRLVDAVDGDERVFYRAVQAEWALARGEKATGALPAGAGRSLAEAELAIRRNDPGAAAAALEQAAYGLGGALGCALMTAAARFSAVAGDPASAAEQRFVAARLAGGGASLGSLASRLPDLARLAVQGEADAEATAALDEMMAALPPSALATAVARWAARLARRRGDDRHAWRILGAAAADADSPRLRRDRVALATAGVAKDDRAGMEALFAAASADESDDTGRAVLAWRRARAVVAADPGEGARAAAASMLEGALAVAPDAVPLALAAETLGQSAGDGESRARSLRLWAAHDPARADAAALALARLPAPANTNAGGDGRAAWRAAAGAVPRSLAFWRWAAAAWAAGDDSEAGLALGAGLGAWPGVAATLGSAWRERIAELREPSAGGAAPAADKPGEAGGADAGVDAARAAQRLRRALAIPASERDARGDALAEVLAVMPDHPVALALLMVHGSHRPDAVAAALWAAGQTPADASAGAGAAAEARRGSQLCAVEWLIQGSNRVRALELARELLSRDPAWPPARDLVRQLAATGPAPAERARLLLSVADAAASDGECLRVAEAHEVLGEREPAVALFHALADGPLAGDARRGLLRTQGPVADTPVGARVDGWLQAARAGRWGELVDRLESEPPHEESASAATLYLAAMLEDGRHDGKRSGRLAKGALAAAAGGRRGAPAPGLLPAMRALDAALASGEGGLADVVAAAQTLAARIARAEGPGMPRSAAAVLVGAGLTLHARGHLREAEMLLRAALANDPHSLPALAGLNALLVDGADWREVVDLCERQAALLRLPAHRAATLLFAARVALARGADDPSRAVSLLRQVLTIAPDNQDAFERLRIVLEDSGDHARVAELLAARIAVATNPFEVTALRLARADILHAQLGDRAAARADLAAILQKEPQHARALSRLADLQYEDGAYAEAAELYISRARTERSPDRLREIFLRLGRIYSQQVPDAKRAAGAYARLLQLDRGNHEALAQLSDLYTAAADTKNALVVTDRLIEIERDRDRRVAYLVRLGQLWERAGEPRRAVAALRRAVEEAPRDLTAVAELARHLERTHDFAGRRVLLDQALSTLQSEMQGGHLSLTALRAAAAILEWRGKLAAAAAATQLVAAVSGDANARQAVASWAAPPAAGRPLRALGDPEIDDQTFSPALTPGIRHIFRLLGPLLSKGPADIKAHHLGRGERIARGHAPRDIVDRLAAQLGVMDFDLYVKRPAAPDAPAPLTVEAGTPPAVIIGAAIVALGPAAVRFAAARALRLAATHLDLVVGPPPAAVGALLVGVIRPFIPEYQHPQVSSADAVAAEARVSKLLPRKLRQEIMPFALESAGNLDLGALRAAARDGANAVGLLAAGDLPAALAVLMAARGGSGAPLSLPAIAADQEAMALLNFALSDLHADLARAME